MAAQESSSGAGAGAAVGSGAGSAVASGAGSAVGSVAGAWVTAGKTTAAGASVAWVIFQPGTWMQAPRPRSMARASSREMVFFMYLSPFPSFMVRLMVQYLEAPIELF